MKKHPDYASAKAGDRSAACRMVLSLMDNPEAQAKLRSLAEQHPDAVVVPVHGVEASGRTNQIPGALADYIALRAGLKADASIVQTNAVRRTGADLWHRIACRPAFAGSVQQNKNYVLVDDVTSGGTLSELRRYIEQRGGNVVQFSCAAAASFSRNIALSKDTQLALESHYGVPPLKSFLQEFNLYDGNYKALTESEARAIRSAGSLAEAGSRIAQARAHSRQSQQCPLVQGPGRVPLHAPTTKLTRTAALHR